MDKIKSYLGDCTCSDMYKTRDITDPQCVLCNYSEEVEKLLHEHLIGFQIYLHDKGLINNHDWDFEKEAKKYIKN